MLTLKENAHVLKLKKKKIKVNIKTSKKKNNLK